MWLLFHWWCKWLNAELKDLFSNVVENLAIVFQNYSSCCVFQVCYKLQQQNVSDGIAYCADLKSTWQRPWLKSEHPLHHANWHHTSPTIIVTFAQKYPLCLLFANNYSNWLKGKSQDYRVCFSVFDNYQQAHFQSFTCLLACLFRANSNSIN